MRPIKFRGRELLTGRLVYSEFLGLPRFFKLLDDGDIELIGQFTGLHDKNGKPIFEGDVLEYPASPRLQYVTWDTERGRWLDVEYHERCSIIGNIHEHGYLIDNTDTKV